LESWPTHALQRPAHAHAVHARVACCPGMVSQAMGQSIWKAVGSEHGFMPVVASTAYIVLEALGVLLVTCFGITQALAQGS
jgi:hypothetical protein